MYAIEFETDIRDGMVKIPDQYSHFKNRHAKIVVMVEGEEVDQELKAISEHSASLVDEWRSDLEDDVWT